MAEQTAEQAYEVLEALSRAVPDAAPEWHPILYALSLRAALHPVLRPYREDPLLTIGGEFVSLDARIAALTDEATDLSGADDIFRSLPIADRDAIGIFESRPQTRSVLGASRPGTIGGALYLPARQIAVACEIRVFFAPNGDHLRVGWDRPVAVRPLGPAIESSAEHVLRTALIFLEKSSALPTTLSPGYVYYDVCGPQLTDYLAENVAGDSLELPLLLAMVSALTGEPIPITFGATGAIKVSRTTHVPLVLPVGNVTEKALAFSTYRFVSPPDYPIFLAPAGSGIEESQSLIPVSTAPQALRRTFEAAGFSGATNSDHSVAAHDVSESETANVIVCALLDEMPTPLSTDLQSEWRRLVRSALRRRGGVPVHPMESDQFTECAGFTSSDAAVLAAIAVNQTLRCYPWPNSATDDGGALLPRIAIHAAETAAGPGEDWQRQALRIAEAAPRGQILLSAHARERLADSERASFVVTALGAYRLRDLRPPISLWRIDTLAGPSTAAAKDQIDPHSLDDQGHNLPAQMVPTFGREKDISILRRLLTGRGSVEPLVTLTGPGGVGKTRLALEVAASVAGVFSDGVWVVRVGSAPEAADENTPAAEDIAATVAETLRIAPPIVRNATILQAVSDALRDTRTLLVLDGCESSAMNHAVAAFIESLRSSACRIACIVTARSALQVAGETVYAVAPLPIVSTIEVVDASEIEVSPAISLFCARVRLSRPDFALTDPENRRLVADICRHLEGLPLAIELAAASLGPLSLQAIAERLADKKVVSRRSPAVRRTMEWAYALLEPHEQDLLAALSVFRDGFTAEAAEAVGDPEMTGEALLVLEERSLIQRRQDAPERYRLHSVIQEFARHKLTASGREEAARAAHARYIVYLAGRHGGVEPNSAHETASFDRLDSEMQNLRAAISYLRTHSPASVPSVVADLANFLRYRGHIREWLSWPTMAVRLLSDSEAVTLVGAHVNLCRAAMCLDINMLDEAEPHLQAAYDNAVARSDWANAASALNLRGLARSRMRRWEEAHAAHSEARELNRRAESKHGEIIATNNLGLLASLQNDPSEAIRYYETAAALSRAIDDRRGLAIALGNLGFLALEGDDLPTARRYFEEFLALSRLLRDATRVAHALINLGDVLNRQGEWETGTPLLAVAEAMMTRQKHPVLAEAVRCLGEAEPHYGAQRLTALRYELNGFSLPVLLQLDPSRYAPHPLSISAAEQRSTKMERPLQ